jgi:hypothetical protein
MPLIPLRAHVNLQRRHMPTPMSLYKLLPAFTKQEALKVEDGLS